LLLHAGAERVSLCADLPRQERCADGAGRRDHRADPRRRLLLGPAHGRGAAGLGAGRPHLLVLRRALRRRPHVRRRQDVVTPKKDGRAAYMLGVVATLKVKPGMEREFEAVAKELVAKVNANEPGCRLYALHRLDGDAPTYVFMERYVDQAAV